MINIGEVIQWELEQVGILNLEDLKKTGSARALFMIHNNGGNGCLSMLYALEGAIKEIRWHDLTKEEKEKVKAEYEELLKDNAPDL
jgi:DNA transformation protein